MSVKQRLEEVRSYMKKENIMVSVIANPDHQFYLGGFKAIMYSRPIIFTIEQNSTNLVIPALEEVHARDEAQVDNIKVYYEHPEMSHEGIDPFEHLKELLVGFSKDSNIGVDMASMPAEQVNFIKELGYEVLDIGPKIVEMRYIKDKKELELIREAGKLVNLAVSKSLDACKEGITEIEMDAIGTKALFEETAKNHPDSTLDLFVMSPSGVERSI